MKPTLTSALLSLSLVTAASAQIELRRYRVAPIDMPSTSIHSVNNDGWTIVGTGTGGFLCKPGHPAVDIDTAVAGTLVGTPRTNHIGPSGLVVGAELLTTGWDGFVWDPHTGATTRFRTPATIAQSTYPMWVFRDGTTLSHLYTGAQGHWDQLLFRDPSGGMRMTAFATSVPSATEYAFAVGPAAEGPWVVLNGWNEWVPGSGWSAASVKLLNPAGQLLTLPTAAIGGVGVDSSGRVLVRTSTSNYAIYDGAQLLPLPAGIRQWDHIDEQGRVYGWDYAPTQWTQQYIRIGDRSVRLDALVDDLALTEMFNPEYSPGGAMVFLTATYAGQQTPVALIPDRPCLALQIDPFRKRGNSLRREILVGDNMQMTVIGGDPGQVAAVFAINASPPLPLGWGQLDAQGEATFALGIPPSARGLRLQLAAYALDSRYGVLDSPVRVVDIN